MGGLPFVFAVSWPSVHKVKGAEAMTEIFVWSVNITEKVLQEIDFGPSAYLYSILQEIYRLGKPGTNHSLH